MKINLCIANHTASAQRSLHDQLIWLLAGFRDLGHDATLGYWLDHDALNIMWENFSPVDAAVLDGYDVGIIMTEHFAGGIMNGLTGPHWQKRHAGAVDALKRSRFALSLLPQSLPFIAEHTRGAHLHLGFCEDLVIDGDDPVYDFSFHGMITPERLAVLERLGTRGFKVARPNGITTGDNKDSLIAATKVNLSLRTSPTFPSPSVARVGRVIHAQRGCLQEWTPTPLWPANLVPWSAEGEDICDVAAALLSSWRERAYVAFEQYRMTPMRDCLGAALDAVL